MLRITGDTCNMIGAVLTHQQPLQQVIGVYYIIQDIFLLGQYLYYTRIYHSSRREFGFWRHRASESMAGSAVVVPVMLFGAFGGLSQLGPGAAADNSAVGFPPIFESYTDAVS